jgi:Reverse transcriptase (RNA-dependent DNA polymerase)
VLSYQNLPSPVRSCPPSPQPLDYDPNFFNSAEEQREYFERQQLYLQNQARRSQSEEDRECHRRLTEVFKHSVGINRGRSDDPWVEDFMQHYVPNRQIDEPINDPVVQPQEGPSGSQPRHSGHTRQPQEGLSGLQPRRSGHTRQPVVRPDNIYGNQNPIESEQMSNQGFQRLTEGVPAPSGSSNRPKSPPSEGKGKQRADYLAWIVQEGGAGLINFLLSATVKPTDGAGGKLPDVRNVREWHYRDLMHFPEAAQKEWKAACFEELESLKKRSIFKLTNLPKGHKTIGCRWVFDIKSDGRKKARLVAQGFSQVKGIDYNELFSPVVWFESMRVIFALAALNGWYMTGVDVRTAYLYGKLDEEIYMRQPEGFVTIGQENKVICLQRALYGLKQAGLAWWKELSQSMKVLGFKHLNSDAGIFVCCEGTELIVAVVYVDDAMFFGKNKKLVNKKKALFMAKWECRDLGEVKEFLRMQVKRQGLDITIDQVNYLKKVLERFQMTNAKATQTPLPSNWDLKENKGKAMAAEVTRYQSIIGSLLYLMIGTCPDISYAVTHLSQFSINPSEDHYKAALHICRYLASTQDYKLVYGKTADKGLMAYTDSDWAADKIRRCSVTGYFFKLANGIISWRSHAQKTVALSSTEAEYMAISDCSQQAVWIKTLIEELGIRLNAIPLYGDNQGSIFIASSPVQESRTKHIDIQYHYIREVIGAKKVKLMFMPGEMNPADMFTKNLQKIKFLKF